MTKPSEDEHLEFKEAKSCYDSGKLTKYCAALANEGGGKMVLGVTDKPPRQVVGSQAFSTLERTKAGLIRDLRLRIDAEEIPHPNGHVVVFHVPSRPIGQPIQYKGAYWMRAGEELVPMTPDMLKRIFNEAGPDFSAEVCPRADLSCLSPKAVAHFRQRWHRKSGNSRLEELSDEELLTNAELLCDGGVTYAALILLGAPEALNRHLAEAEVIFEYRSGEDSIRFQQRQNYREGFLLFHDDLWNKINLRNEVHQYQEGFFRHDIPTFNEVVVREAILNAVSHRDYRDAGSVFVRQFPRKLEVTSPGGFPEGITAENILRRQSPRNRRIAEAFERCGLVEKSGQGMDLMFETSIKEGKPRPDFSGTDAWQVYLTLWGEVQDTDFVLFLERVASETSETFSTSDFLLLDVVRRGDRIPKDLRDRARHLREAGVLERTGRGRGTRYLLSRRFYRLTGKKGAYTRKRGLDRGANKALLLRHIEDNASEGSPLRDLADVVLDLTRGQILGLLKELKKEGSIHVLGRNRGARWHPGPSIGDADS